MRAMGKSTSGAMMPAANPAEKQSAFFSGDQYLQCEGTPCTQVWQIRDVPVGLDFEVYYKYLDDKGTRQPVKISDFVSDQPGSVSGAASNRIDDTEDRCLNRSVSGRVRDVGFVQAGAGSTSRCSMS